MNALSLEGQRVLVVDDDRVVAEMLREVVTEFGCTSSGIVHDFNTALRRASDVPCDIAVLDINLGGRPSWPIADILAARGVPILFVTGHDSIAIAEAYRRAPRLQKPFRAAELRDALLRTLAGGRADQGQVGRPV